MHDQPATPEPLPGEAQPTPLLPTDPPRIGDFWLDARLVQRPVGVAYLAHDQHGPAMMLTLSEGAAADAVARERLAGQVNQLHLDTVVARGGQGQDGGRLAHLYRPTTGDPVAPDPTPNAPWVALAWDGSAAAVAEATRILRSVDMTSSGFVGDPSGPDYQLHWHDDAAPGTSRVWPLPWPGRTDRAGWMSLAVSWLLMVLLAALALLIAVLLFQNKPPVPPPPPIPTTPPPSSSQSQSPPPSSSPSSASPSKGQSSPSSASPSQGSSSPSSASPSSASPSNSQSGSPTPSSGSPSPTRPSDHPSMESPMPSGTASGPAGTKTPNRRL